MNLLDEIYRSEDLLCKGLHEINDRGELNPQSLEQLGDLLDAAKDMYSVTMKAEYGYSERGDMWDNSYGSYARRRDSRGRYSRGYDEYSHNDYSQNNYRGYSRDEDEIKMLEDKMRRATNEEERERYRRRIIDIENHR